MAKFHTLEQEDHPESLADTRPCVEVDFLGKSLTTITTNQEDKEVQETSPSQHFSTCEEPARVRGRQWGPSALSHFGLGQQTPA